MRSNSHQHALLYKTHAKSDQGCKWVHSQITIFSVDNQKHLPYYLMCFTHTTGIQWWHGYANDLSHQLGSYSALLPITFRVWQHSQNFNMHSAWILYQWSCFNLLTTQQPWQTCMPNTWPFPHCWCVSSVSINGTMAINRGNCHERINICCLLTFFPCHNCGVNAIMAITSDIILSHHW